MPDITDENAENMFRFYTLNQRDVDNMLNNEVYNSERSSKSPTESLKYNIRKNLNSTQTQFRSSSSQPLKKGDKLLARLTNAVESGKPSEFEYWDFGEGVKKQRLSKSIQYEANHFQSVVKSLKSKHDKTIKNRTQLFLTTTFHENFEKKKSEASINAERERSMLEKSLKENSTYKVGFKLLDVSNNSDHMIHSIAKETTPSNTLKKEYSHLLSYGAVMNKSQKCELNRVFNIEQSKGNMKSDRVSTQQSRLTESNKNDHLILPSIECSQLAVKRKSSVDTKLRNSATQQTSNTNRDLRPAARHAKDKLVPVKSTAMPCHAKKCNLTLLHYLNI